MMKYRIILCILLIAGCVSCKKNRHLSGKEDTSILIKVERFDREFNQLKSPNCKCNKDCLAKQHPEFFPIYNQGVIKIGAYNAPGYNQYVSRFLSDDIYTTVYDTVQVYFPNMDTQNSALTKAFRNYNQLFPERTVPKCYTHISGFNEAIVVGDSIMSISLENYLGQDHIFYRNLGIYAYQLPKKEPSYMLADAMRGWISSDFPNTSNKTNLLSEIIHEGKILYILETVLPNENKNKLIGLTDKNLKWCILNEASVWRYMIEEKHLFSTTQLTIAKYLNDGPFFNFFGENTSPMIGKYIGWQIVRSYMGKNKNVDIKTLLNNTNSQEILQMSGYKPS